MRNSENIIAEWLGNEMNIPFSSIHLHAIGGGSINDTFRVTIDSGRQFFLKLNSARKYPALFEKEINGLAILGQQKIFPVPNVVLSKTVEDTQLLLLEWIGTGIKDRNFWQSFGEQLAQLHLVTHEQFGFYEDNFMGALPQINTLTNNWTDFFVLRRLHPQIKLATENHLLQQKHINAFEKLEGKLKNIFNEEPPSLLHGDLWSGNYMCNSNSQPVLIDPAVYFGHRCMDLAMTTLFGGFDKYFYDAYHYHYPFPSGYTAQWEICNLYPLLIHLNLFGMSYQKQVDNILKKFS